MEPGRQEDRIEGAPGWVELALALVPAEIAFVPVAVKKYLTSRARHVST
jgi:hypothetical protein